MSHYFISFWAETRLTEKVITLSENDTSTRKMAEEGSTSEVGRLRSAGGVESIKGTKWTS